MKIQPRLKNRRKKTRYLPPKLAKKIETLAAIADCSEGFVETTLLQKILDTHEQRDYDEDESKANNSRTRTRRRKNKTLAFEHRKKAAS